MNLEISRLHRSSCIMEFAKNILQKFSYPLRQPNSNFGSNSFELIIDSKTIQVHRNLFIFVFDKKILPNKTKKFTQFLNVFRLVLYCPFLHILADLHLKTKKSIFFVETRTRKNKKGVLHALVTESTKFNVQILCTRKR